MIIKPSLLYDFYTVKKSIDIFLNINHAISKINANSSPRIPTSRNRRQASASAAPLHPWSRGTWPSVAFAHHHQLIDSNNRSLSQRRRRLPQQLREMGHLLQGVFSFLPARCQAHKPSSSHPLKRPGAVSLIKRPAKSGRFCGRDQQDVGSAGGDMDVESRPPGDCGLRTYCCHGGSPAVSAELVLKVSCQQQVKPFPYFVTSTSDNSTKQLTIRFLMCADQREGTLRSNAA